MTTCKNCGIKYDGGDRCPVCQWMKADKPKRAKHPRRKPQTPRSQVRSALRKLWLRSRERAAALKATGYCCVACGAKQSKAVGRECDVQVHHIDGIAGWETIIDAIFAHILVPPDKLRPLCTTCHDAEHEKAVDITDADVLSCAATNEETTHA